MRNSIFRKITALVVTVFFCFSSLSADASAAIVGSTPPIADIADILPVIPVSQGKITGISNAASDTVVINIQDLHSHADTQRNISKIIDLMASKYNVSAVYTEGGHGIIDISWINIIKDEALKTRLIDQMLENGSLTGSEYFAMTSNSGIKLNGIEDKNLHRENIRRHAEIEYNKSKYEAVIAEVNKEIETLNKLYTNRRNVNFNEMIEKYNAKKMTDSEFYTMLKKYVSAINVAPQRYNSITRISLNDYPNTQLYLDMVNESRKTNGKRTAAELQMLIASLKNSLPYSQYKQLQDATDNFQDSEKVIEFVSAFLKNNPELISQYKHLNRRAAVNNYIKMLNPLELLTEQRRLSEKIKFALSYSNTEAEIAFISDFKKYFRDFLTANLTQDDWAYVKENLDTFLNIYAKYAAYNNLTGMETDFAELTKYYDTNTRRDEIFLSNILDKNFTPKTIEVPNSAAEILKAANDVKIVITGGFHSKGLERLLAQKGVTSILVTPNVTTGISKAQANYQRIMQEQAKLPAEALAPEVLSSVPNQAYHVTQIFQAAVNAGLSIPEIEKLIQDANLQNMVKIVNDQVEVNGSVLNQTVDTQTASEGVSLLKSLTSVNFNTIETKTLKVVANVLQKFGVQEADVIAAVEEAGLANAKEIAGVEMREFRHYPAFIQQILLNKELSKVQSQKEIFSIIEKINPEKLEFIKDQPTFGYKITTSDVSKYPQKLIDSIGAVDNAKYLPISDLAAFERMSPEQQKAALREAVSKEFARNIGSVIVMQAKKDGTLDAYIMGVKDFQEKNEEKPSREAIEKNAKLASQLTVDLIGTDIEADKNVVGILKIALVTMVKMSALGYDSAREITIEAPWGGTQTKPAGTDAYIVINGNEVYMVNQEADGLPIGYIGRQTASVVDYTDKSVTEALSNLFEKLILDCENKGKNIDSVSIAGYEANIINSKTYKAVNFAVQSINGGININRDGSIDIVAETSKAAYREVHELGRGVKTADDIRNYLNNYFSSTDSDRLTSEIVKIIRDLINSSVALTSDRLLNKWYSRLLIKLFGNNGLKIVQCAIAPIAEMFWFGRIHQEGSAMEQFLNIHSKAVGEDRERMASGVSNVYARAVYFAGAFANSPIRRIANLAVSIASIKAHREYNRGLWESGEQQLSLSSDDGESGFTAESFDKDSETYINELGMTLQEAETLRQAFNLNSIDDVRPFVLAREAAGLKNLSPQEIIAKYGEYKDVLSYLISQIHSSDIHYFDTQINQTSVNDKITYMKFDASNTAVPADIKAADRLKVIEGLSAGEAEAALADIKDESRLQLMEGLFINLFSGDFNNEAESALTVQNRLKLLQEMLVINETASRKINPADFFDFAFYNVILNPEVSALAKQAKAKLTPKPGIKLYSFAPFAALPFISSFVDKISNWIGGGDLAATVITAVLLTIPIIVAGGALFIRWKKSHGYETASTSQTETDSTSSTRDEPASTSQTEADSTSSTRDETASTSQTETDSTSSTRDETASTSQTETDSTSSTRDETASTSQTETNANAEAMRKKAEENKTMQNFKIIFETLNITDMMPDLYDLAKKGDYEGFFKAAETYGGNTTYQNVCSLEKNYNYYSSSIFEKIIEENKDALNYVLPLYNLDKLLRIHSTKIALIANALYTIKDTSYGILSLAVNNKYIMGFIAEAIKRNINIDAFLNEYSVLAHIFEMKKSPSRRKTANGVTNPYVNSDSLRSLPWFITDPRAAANILFSYNKQDALEKMQAIFENPNLKNFINAKSIFALEEFVEKFEGTSSQMLQYLEEGGFTAEIFDKDSEAYIEIHIINEFYIMNMTLSEAKMLQQTFNLNSIADVRLFLLASEAAGLKGLNAQEIAANYGEYKDILSYLISRIRSSNIDLLDPDMYFHYIEGEKVGYIKAKQINFDASRIVFNILTPTNTFYGDEESRSRWQIMEKLFINLFRGGYNNEAEAVPIVQNRLKLLQKMLVINETSSRKVASADFFDYAFLNVIHPDSRVDTLIRQAGAKIAQDNNSFLSQNSEDTSADIDTSPAVRVIQDKLLELGKDKKNNLGIRSRDLRKFTKTDIGLTAWQVEKLSETAEFHHQGQARKDPAKTPYMAHILGVAGVLIRAGVTDANLIAGAFLHDSIEDSFDYYEAYYQKYKPELLYLSPAEKRDRLTKEEKDVLKKEIIPGMKETVINKLKDSLRRQADFTEADIVEIIGYAEAMTKEKGKTMYDYFLGLIQKGERAAALKLADRIYNVGDLKNNPEMAAGYLFDSTFNEFMVARYGKGSKAVSLLNAVKDQVLRDMFASSWIDAAASDNNIVYTYRPFIMELVLGFFKRLNAVPVNAAIAEFTDMGNTEAFNKQLDAAAPGTVFVANDVISGKGSTIRINGVPLRVTTVTNSRGKKFKVFSAKDADRKAILEVLLDAKIADSISDFVIEDTDPENVNDITFENTSRGSIIKAGSAVMEKFKENLSDFATGLSEIIRDWRNAQVDKNILSIAHLDGEDHAAQAVINTLSNQKKEQQSRVMLNAEQLKKLTENNANKVKALRALGVEIFVNAADDSLSKEERAKLNAIYTEMGISGILREGKLLDLNTGKEISAREFSNELHLNGKSLDEILSEPYLGWNIIGVNVIKEQISNSRNILLSNNILEAAIGLLGKTFTFKEINPQEASNMANQLRFESALTINGSLTKEAAAEIVKNLPEMHKISIMISQLGAQKEAYYGETAKTEYEKTVIARILVLNMIERAKVEGKTLMIEKDLGTQTMLAALIAKLEDAVLDVESISFDLSGSENLALGAIVALALSENATQEEVKQAIAAVKDSSFIPMAGTVNLKEARKQYENVAIGTRAILAAA